MEWRRRVTIPSPRAPLRFSCCHWYRESSLERYVATMSSFATQNSCIETPTVELSESIVSFCFCLS